MRILDGPKQGDDRENSGSESGSTSGSNSYNSSGSSNDPTTGATKQHKRVRKRGRKSKSDKGSNVVPNGVANGGVCSTGGGSDNLSISYNSHTNQNYVITNGFSPSLQEKEDGGRGSNENKILKRGPGKKYPLTPTPTFLNNTSSNNNEGEPSPFFSATTTSSKQDRSRLASDDMDLVDYEDLGTSTSISSCSGNEQQDEESFQSHSHQKLMLNFSGSPKILKSKKTSPKMEDGNGESVGANNNLFNSESTIDFENIPCSSSSLRERLSSQRSRNNSLTLSISKSASKTSAELVPVYEDTFIESVNKNENNFSISNSAGQKRRSLSRSESFNRSESQDRLSIGTIDDKPHDKYVNSGVGRHFGKKKAISTTSLPRDGESFGDGDSDKVACLNYLMRLKAVTIVFFGTVFVLSISSLLFVFPLIVDPILYGLEAQFSLQPVNCRTTNLRNGVGPVECSLPSCRAGCTADLFLCIFIDVEYSYYVDSPLLLTSSTTPSAILQHKDNNISEPVKNFNDSHNNSSSTLNSTTLVTKQGTLYININGCGYPPSVNCSEFVRQYGTNGTEFGCYYSARNDTVVVPYYNHSEEKYNVYIAILVPIIIAVLSALTLFLLLKCLNCSRGARALVLNKSSSQLKLLDKDGSSLGSGGGGGGTSGKSAKEVSKKWKNRKDKDFAYSNGNGVKKMNGVGHHQMNYYHADDVITDGEGPYMNGSVPKANGHALQNTVGGLMGIVSPSKIHKSIQNMPQHDSLDKHSSASPEHGQMRRPRYAKKNEVHKGPYYSRNALKEDQLFTPSNNNIKDKSGATNGKLAEHKF